MSFWDNPSLVARRICRIRLIVIVQIYAVIFVLCGLCRVGSAIFGEQSFTNQMSTYQMIVEGYLIALLICARSRTLFIVFSVYLMYRISSLSVGITTSLYNIEEDLNFVIVDVSTLFIYTSALLTFSLIGFG
ncbi:DUF4956 domain-containing protein [Caenorhabditis elegans]|uniref:DUF4956 domain-containing protein n=1 Tax=Caenorhabditis elegans TaxID=6239 RepID=Q564V9_CAEEL|nr:DUF4956 domain-containing protein [Caenorhabditis elegans]CAI79243.2 DUF4956 domain-containing protein [Caenorhabditis elegans]|eukprot:NP_001021460.2 Uncharacterized protein CELE_F36H2.4 [Caenorhabditis elegans]